MSVFLPKINKKLEDAGSPKKFNNFLGLTLVTGFGAGIVRNNTLYIGDNSGAGEIWLLRIRRLAQNVYNLENQDNLDKFLKGQTKEKNIIGTDRTIKYDPEQKIRVGISQIGTSKAISLGAYSYALSMLDH